MKFSRKMILIPATGREEPETEKMSELDQEMSAILKNPRLSTKEKVEKYNEVLRRNLIFENRLLHKPQGIQENMNPGIVLNESFDNKSINSSASTNTSRESDASSSIKLPKKEVREEEEGDEEEEEEEEKREDEEEGDDADLIRMSKRILKETHPIWESTPRRFNREKKQKHDYLESPSSLQTSLDRKKKKKKKLLDNKLVVKNI